MSPPTAAAADEEGPVGAKKASDGVPEPAPLPEPLWGRGTLGCPWREAEAEAEDEDEDEDEDDDEVEDDGSPASTRTGAGAGDRMRPGGGAEPPATS